MLTKLANSLSSSNIHYCILHGWQSLPENLTSDLDIVVAPKDLRALEGILRNCNGERPVQLLQHESSCFHFVLAKRQGQKIRFIPVDVATNYRGDWRIFFTAEQLLAGRRRWNGFWIASPQVESAYLLVKKVLKGTMPDHQKERLRELFEELSDKTEAIARRLFGKTMGNIVVSWICSSNWNALEANLPRLKRALLWHALKHDPLSPLRYCWPELKRFWNRWRYPTGMFVVVLGPDGAGKTTLIQHLKESLAGAFRRTTVFHLRPKLMGRKTADSPVTDPHGKRPHSLWLSLLKISYYLLDYGLGYLFKVRLKLVRSTLVLFDRYYDDLLVDPCRYRYGGPQWFVRVTRCFIRRPDLVFVLDVPEEQLLARKQEVSLAELQRQRKAYRRLAVEDTNAILLDGSLPAEEVGRTASQTVVDHLHERFLKRRHLWFSENSIDTLSWLASTLSSPSEKACITLSKLAREISETHWQTNSSFGWLRLKDGRGYLIPLDSRQSGINALRLYSAQKLKARLAKRLLSIGLKAAIAQSLVPKVHVLIRQDLPGKARSQVLLLDHLKKLLGRQDLSYAISLGTPGGYRKPVIQVMSKEGQIIGYVKIGWSDRTIRIVQNEERALKFLNNSEMTTAAFPTIVYYGWWEQRYILIQTIPFQRKLPRISMRLTYKHMLFLKDLFSLALVYQDLAETALIADISARMQTMKEKGFASSASILEPTFEAISRQLEGVEIPFGYSHGDFVPWNTLWLDSRLCIFDWEHASPSRPAAWDVFHFLIQTALHVRNANISSIVRTIESTDELNKYFAVLSVDRKLIAPLCGLYLIDLISWWCSVANYSEFTHNENRLLDYIRLLQVATGDLRRKV